MKVALINRRYTTTGGAERFLVGLARYLRDAGHMVHVHCSEVRSDLRSEPGVVFEDLPLVRPAKTASQWWRSRQVDADVVMSFGRGHGHDVVRCGGGAHAAWQTECRPAWMLDPSEWLERWLDRDTVRSAGVVITPSGMARDDLRRHYGVTARVIHNGVDTQLFQPGPGGEGLLFVGRGFLRKGLDVAIDVARRLKRPLTVVGEDARLGRWRQENPDVRFLGNVLDVESWYGRFDALLLPSLYEPYGNVCLEAMACGTPALTTSRNGVKEVLPGELVADGVDALVEATAQALAGGTELRARCRDIAVALPPQKAYQAVERVLVESRR